MGWTVGKLSWLRACSTSGCRPRANMATASVVLHIFTTLNTLSSAKTQHANEQRSTRASQSHTVQAGERATQTARRAEQRGVFRFPWLPISARGQSGYSMGRFALPKCAALPYQLRENGCPFREGGGRAAEGEAVFPPVPPCACRPIGNEGTDLLESQRGPLSGGMKTSCTKSST